MVETVETTPALHIAQMDLNSHALGDIGTVMTRDTDPSQIPAALVVDIKERRLCGVFNDNSTHVIKFLNNKEFEGIISAYGKARANNAGLTMTFYDAAALKSTRDSFGQIDSDNVVAYTAAVHKIARAVPVTLR